MEEAQKQARQTLLWSLDIFMATCKMMTVVAIKK